MGRSKGELESETPAKLRLAAAMKAAGYTWEAIAARFNRSVDSTQNLAYDHRQKWDELYQEALQQIVFEEIEPSALMANKDIMERYANSDEVPEQQLRQRAAHSLLQYVSRRRKSVQRMEIVPGKVDEVEQNVIDIAKANIKEAAEDAAAEEKPDKSPALPN